jgi:ABC-type antimicrobial peptide transport system permease subunit
MALGAQQADVLKLVAAKGFVLTLIGEGIGIFGALWLTRFLTNLLYGVRVTDFATYAVVSTALAVVALLASYIPARRATKVDPMATLRHG